MKLGNDIIEIDRIRQAIEKSSSFKARVYTIHEIEYCKSRNKGCYESFAGIYAAKEIGRASCRERVSSPV